MCQIWILTWFSHHVSTQQDMCFGFVVSGEQLCAVKNICARERAHE